MEKELSEIQQAINTLLNVKSLVRRKKKRQSEKKKELFISILNSIQQLSDRQNIMYADLQLDFSDYDEQFLEIIDALILLHFGKDATEIIGWYLWERVNPDGTLNYLEDIEGNQFTLENVQELWELLVTLNPSLNE